MALQLKRLGIQNVYPMQGGIEAWLEEGFPTDAPMGTPMDTHIDAQTDAPSAEA